ncbi:MAG: glycosyltransferase [Actinobacteria bacterium]|nr:MAG: glycosyltransferase [Actinomycetota bacterium]
MKVSVIIPTYNRASKTKKAVESVLAQTLAPYEIIVIDDGSTDSTKQKLSKVAGIKYVYQKHKGVSAARNKGIAESSGDYIAFLDSDDTWIADKLEKQVAYHKSNRFLISQTDETWIKNGKHFNPKNYHAKKEGLIFEDCLKRCLISPSAVLINKSLFYEVGLFDESLPACEDYDLWLRIARRYPIGLVAEKLVVKTGGHKDQLSSKYFGMDRFRVAAIHKVLMLPLSLKQRQQALRALVNKCNILANGCKKRGKQKEAVVYCQKIRQFEKEIKNSQELDLLQKLPTGLAEYIISKDIAYRRFEHLNNCKANELQIFRKLALNLNPSASNFEEITKNLIDICKRDKITINALKAKLKINFNGCKNPAKKLLKIREEIFKARYPVFSGIIKKIDTKVQALSTNSKVNISWDKSLENEGLELIIKLNDKGDIKELKQWLDAVGENKLDDILRLFNEL